LCRIAADMAPRSMLAARDVAQLLKLQLVREEHSKLELTAIGRERHRQIAGTIAPGGQAEELNAGR
jgi:hypothetical protein